MSFLSEQAKLFLKNNREKTIVFTNGCFDILHSGHVQYLNHAKKLGEVLFVGLNSDRSVKALKGEERPLNQEGDRKYILENLKAVDFVEIFDEETPYNLIKEVMPDILVKGGDWQPKDIVGSDIVLSNNGQVRSLDFKDGYSTTGIINNIRGN
jgi:D-glycero-beta-D-manno-heptose 1-phosphate adenylyltransferase